MEVESTLSVNEVVFVLIDLWFASPLLITENVTCYICYGISKKFTRRNCRIHFHFVFLLQQNAYDGTTPT